MYYVKKKNKKTKVLGWSFDLFNIFPLPHTWLTQQHQQHLLFHRFPTSRITHTRCEVGGERKEKQIQLSHLLKFLQDDILYREVDDGTFVTVYYIFI